MNHKLMHYMMRLEINMMGFRRDKHDALVNHLLKTEGLEEAIVYRKVFIVMVLYKDQTVCFDGYPMFMSEEEIVEHHTQAIRELKDKVRSRIKDLRNLSRESKDES